MTTNSGDGFLESELKQILRDECGAVSPPLSLKRADNDAFEIHDASSLLVTLCPAGREPYDYLLVDFADVRGWDGSHQLHVVAQAAERLDLSVLELESRLEYSPRQWAAARGRYHSPDPARRTEARRIELEREIEFYMRRGLPYSETEVDLLREAVSATENQELQKSAQAIRDQKKREDRPVTPVRGRRYTDASERRSLWPFGNRRR